LVCRPLGDATKAKAGCVVTPVERQAIRSRANKWSQGYGSDQAWFVRDVLALDAALTEAEAEEEIRRLDHEAAALEAETRSLRSILRDAQFFITNVPQDDGNDPTGEGREIASEILAKIAALATGTTPK
jgi:hypothetical protein